VHTVLALAIANAVAAAVAAVALGGALPAEAPTAFGGPSAVHIARVGHIETDLEAAEARTLRAVPCAIPSHGATLCFVAASARDHSKGLLPGS
jgi:hypothetical protein